MSKWTFGDAFDYNRDGKMDDLESRAQYMAILEEVRGHEAIEKPLDEMSLDELGDLAAKSGVDPGIYGF